MPRSNRPRNRPRRRGPEPDERDDRGDGGPAALLGTEEWRGEEWTVRRVSGRTGKSYRCPGCDQEIAPATGHVVAWPAYSSGEDRRHWHSPCWSARDRRAAKIKRSRNAPRY